MASKITMYPTGVSQPNRDKSSGLQGKCFEAVRRNGTTYTVNCTDQRDPKYHHEWSNAEEILKGKTIQCGRKSTTMCSHETYYGIKGYRNTCPIAGVTGTYTQPATLKLFFDLSKKSISSSAKIEKVEISFDHRCTGVDVSDGREYTSWGPNFSGFNKYPQIKALKVRIGSQEKVSNTNPPLSSKFSNTGKFVFTDVSYKDLKEKGIDIIYGNNLETNPGNIYIKNLKAEVYYNDGVPYIDGTQSSNSLYIASTDTCRTELSFGVEAGYKQGEKKVPIKNSPKNLRNSIEIDTPAGVSVTKIENSSTNQRKKYYTIIDRSNKTGKKTVTFTIKGTKKKKTFTYNAIKKPKPSISIPDKIERNTLNPGITSIVAKNGCASQITVYVDKVDKNLGPNKKFTFNGINNSNKNNIIPQGEIDRFYEFLANLPCGDRKLFIQRDGEPIKEMVTKIVKIIPTTYTFKITKVDNDEEIKEYKTIQNKEKNDTLKLTYVKTKELINNPSFIIKNSTHGKEENNIPTKNIIDDFSWSNVNKNGASTTFTVGTYYPGNFQIKIEENDSSCIAPATTLNVEIASNHKQYFDEIFVRGEDSTAFDYDYLVALEGDTITTPIYVDTIQLGASFNDIQICAQKNNLAGLTQTQAIDITVTNTSENDIKNLLLELNVLTKDEDGLYQASINEWKESDGLFYNFQEKFNRFNNQDDENISVKNLTSDDDNVDEEDVYIHISEIKSKESLDIKIPYGSSIEKEGFLQILLFGEPMSLYPKGDCPNETETNNAETFTEIPIRIYDSILTSMNIIGENDLLETINNQADCPKECFRTSLEYTIKNIDSSNVEFGSETLIINDPRLNPISFTYKGDVYKEYNGKFYKDLDDLQEEDLQEEDLEEKTTSNVLVEKGEGYRNYSIIGHKITLSIKFDEYNEIEMHQYTNSNGEVTFFVNIPESTGESFTISELLEKAVITPEPFKKGVLTYTVTKNQINYQPGQIVPLQIKLTGQIKYFKNEIKFFPQIINSGEEDSLIVDYEICNLENNEGKVTTTFKTNSYHLIPNEISKNIYCGLDTDLHLFTKLTKVIVENKTLNRLYLSLNNKKRYNKDVKVYIEEENPKYDMVNYSLDNGKIEIEDDKIIWKINYIEEDNTINGYIDFRAKEVGYSTIQAYTSDFIKEMNPKPDFGKNSYNCKCRK